jgi:uncharacterized protein (TIGR03437 family)
LFVNNLILCQFLPTIFANIWGMSVRTLSILGCILALGSTAPAQTPVINPGGIESAAGLGHTTTIAPGSLISIFGTDLASGLAQASSATLSTSLGDVNSVKINGVAAPLQFVASGQINAQAPWELTPGQATVVVTRAGVASAAVAAQVGQFAPALYGFNLGTAQAIAVNADGSVAAPVASINGVTSHPAMSGDTLIFYAAGLGPVGNPPADGSNSTDALRPTSSTLTALVGGAPAQVVFSGLSPQFTGVYQVNLTIPANVTTGGAVPVELMIGGVASADSLTVALQ